MTKGTLHCGVAADALLAKKSYKEFMEPFPVRQKAVKDFLSTFNPRLKTNVFELTDTAGVGGTMPEVQACILTRETAKGGEILNEVRASKGMPPCELVFVDMILAEMDD